MPPANPSNFALLQAFTEADRKTQEVISAHHTRLTLLEDRYEQGSKRYAEERERQSKGITECLNGNRTMVQRFEAFEDHVAEELRGVKRALEKWEEKEAEKQKARDAKEKADTRKLSRRDGYLLAALGVVGLILAPFAIDFVRALAQAASHLA